VPNLTRPVAEACSATSGFQPTLTGGDGARIPFCEYLYAYALSYNSLRFVLTANFPVFVGYWPQQNSVIVSHQGTDPTQLYVTLL